MSAAGFKHLRVSHLEDVVLIEILSADVQGPALAQEFSAELVSIAREDSPKPLLLDLRRCHYFSSMGFSALFRLVKEAKEQRRKIRFCNLHPDVRAGADAVGLKQVVEIHDSETSALAAFAQA
jgi:anti-anti-sigma factor